MNEERITKLEEMLEKLQNKSDEMFERIQKELDEIKWSDNNNECKVDTFERVESGEKYYFICLKDTINVLAQFEAESFSSYNANCFSSNNYFKTKERAEEVKSKIELLLKLERLHDTFCPDYKPNWNDNSELKYFIEFDCDDNVYVWSYTEAFYHTDVYFPNQDIVIKICDILNVELERNKEDETMS